MKRTALLRQMPGSLYSALTMELFERWAYYGMVLVLSIWVVQHLGIRADVYGTVYGLFTGALYFLPVFAGALADRFGYKPALVVAFATLTAGYATLAVVREFWPLVGALALIAIGGSIIKPTIAGTVTRTTEAGSTRPVGFGLYYMMINAGGLIGPVVAAQVRNRAAFPWVFWVSAAACALMLLQALVAYREPVTPAQRASGKTLGQVFGEALLVLRNWRFVLLLVIFAGFWGMINVLFGFMPLYIETFSNLAAAEAAIDRVVPITPWAGQWLNPEVLITLDAFLIVLFQAVVSYLTRRWRTVSAMLAGTALATCAWFIFAASPAAGVIALGIMVWSLGEMTCSARFFQYCGDVAPPDRIALYLGYAFLSLFLGNVISGVWAGLLYQRFIHGPYEAGLPVTPLPFFLGVAAMGAVSAAGLALYARFVTPEQETSTV